MDIENVEKISKRFNRFYKKIPLNIKPLDAKAIVYYSKPFPNEFSRRSQTLLQMQGDAIGLEGNLIMGGNIKRQLQEHENRNRDRNQERRKPTEDSQ